jgi:hypothetical protein
MNLVKVILAGLLVNSSFTFNFINYDDYQIDRNLIVNGGF